MDVLIVESAPTHLIKAALAVDEDCETIQDTHPYIFPSRSHYEILPMYAPCEVPLTNMNVPLDGSIMSVGILNLLSTSLGAITLSSPDPVVAPSIDPNYYATEVDRVVMRYAIRRVVSAFETSEAQAAVAGEVLLPHSWMEVSSTEG